MSELQPEFDAEERAAAESLRAHRPAPSAMFRGALARRLTELDPGYGHRPERLWLYAGALTAAGALLVLLGLLVSTGAV